MTAMLETTRISFNMMDPKAVVLIGRDTEDGPDHALYDPRVHWNPDPAMMASIREEGVLEPVGVRRNGDVYEVIWGRQRVINAREVNETLKPAERMRIPVKIVKADDAKGLSLAITENELKRGEDMFGKAAKAQRLLAYGKSEAEVAVAFGVTPQGLKIILALLEVAPEVKKAVEQNKLPASAAAKLAPLNRSEQKEKLEELLAGGEKITTARAQHVTRTTQAAKKGEEAPSEKPSKRVITKVLKLNKDSGELTGDFVKGVMWSLGDIGPNSIKGLAGLIKQATAPKEKSKKTEEEEE